MLEEATDNGSGAGATIANFGMAKLFLGKEAIMGRASEAAPAKIAAVNALPSMVFFLTVRPAVKRAALVKDEDFDFSLCWWHDRTSGTDDMDKDAQRTKKRLGQT